MKFSRAVWIAFVFTKLALSDGLTVLFHRQAGDFDITLFSTSEQVRAGSNDLSVMVQRPDHSAVMDATVLIHLERVQDMGGIMRLTGIARHGKAANKMLYTSSIKIPETGRWRLAVDVSSGGKNGTTTGEINVLPPQPPVQNYWPLVAMVPLLLIAFVINRKLREKFRARKP